MYLSTVLLGASSLNDVDEVKKGWHKVGILKVVGQITVDPGAKDGSDPHAGSG